MNLIGEDKTMTVKEVTIRGDSVEKERAQESENMIIGAYIPKLSIPYMGSKRKLASKIVDHILDHNPDCKYIYDLFGGGGAISFEAMQRPQIKKVFYNELNTGVVELLKDIVTNGDTEKYFNWIDRDTFCEHKNDNTWFGGLLATCWSFGNDQRTYLYGKDIEALKKEAHEYLMTNGYDLTAKTRIRLIKEFKNISKIGEILCLQHLLNLEFLERLESLKNLERLEISNLSYEKVGIRTPANETIIYLDPPYQGTRKYRYDIINKELSTYIKGSDYKIYMSGYESDLSEVAQFDHRSTLSATHNNKVIEKLFCNRIETIKKTTGQLVFNV